MFQDSNLMALANAGQQITSPDEFQRIQLEALEPYVKILEQPAGKSRRFRYACEKRSVIPIPGKHSSTANETYPTIQVMNYVGRAIVIVSCVTKDLPYKPHPHNVIGREGCNKGICILEINSDEMKIVFSSLAIQKVTKRNTKNALKVREEIDVDPFRTGYSHGSQPNKIDYTVVRLCFQVFLEEGQHGMFTKACEPIVSDPIFDKKAILKIVKLSHCNARCDGSQEMILLCNQVTKNNIQIRFFDDTWEGFGEFLPSHVHKQKAIIFRTPKYKTIDLATSVKVKVELRRPSDFETSDALDFEILPLKKEYPGNYGDLSQATTEAASLLPIFLAGFNSPPENVLEVPKVSWNNFASQPQYNQTFDSDQSMKNLSGDLSSLFLCT